MSPLLLSGLLVLLVLGVESSPTIRRSIRTNSTTTVLKFDTTQGAISAVNLSPSLAALSIEFCYIIDYLGDVGSPNQFSLSLLQNVQNIVGTPPRIRIGGHTQDVSRYDPTSSVTLLNVFEPGNLEAVSVAYNADLFRVLNDNVVSQQQFIFGLNFGQDDVSIPVAAVTAAEEHSQLSRLYAYELGNEPDFYSSQRPVPWNVQTYEQQQVTWLSEISAKIKHSSHGFQIGALAQEPIYQGNFSLVELNKLGLPELVRNVKSYSDHTYPFSVCDEERAALVSLPNLMNHINTIEYFSQWQTEVAAAKDESFEFHIGETGSVSCHGLDGVSNTLGAALWEIDYMLHGATLGFQGVYFHMGTPFFYSMWQPIAYNNTPSHVYPTYYSLLFMADLIADVFEPKILELSAFESENLALYALYSGDKVTKIIVLNLAFYNDTTVERGSETIDIGSLLGENVQVGRFSGPLSTTTDVANVTWLNQTFETGSPSGRRAFEVPRGGFIDVGDSEAVIIERKRV